MPINPRNPESRVGMSSTLVNITLNTQVPLSVHTILSQKFMEIFTIPISSTVEGKFFSISYNNLAFLLILVALLHLLQKIVYFLITF